MYIFAYERLRDEKSDTHHLNLSILANTVKLDLLIGQGVVQGLLGGSLNVGCVFCNASLWFGGQAVRSLVVMCTVEESPEYRAKDSSTHKKQKLHLLDTETDTHPDMVMQGASAAL